MTGEHGCGELPISESVGNLAGRRRSLCTVVIDEDRLRVLPGTSGVFDARRSCVKRRGVPEGSGEDNWRVDDKQKDFGRIERVGRRTGGVGGEQMGGGRQVEGGRVGSAEAIRARNGVEALLRSDALLLKRALSRRLRGVAVPEWRPLSGEVRSLTMRHRASFTEAPADLSAASVRVCSLAIRWMATRSSSARTCAEAGEIRPCIYHHPSI